MGSGWSSPLPVLSMPLAFAGCTAPPTVFENAVLTAAAAVPVLLALAPAAVWVVTRDLAKTLRLLSSTSLWAGVMNSVIWVLFAFIAAKRVECMELVLAYPIILALDFTSLLTLYGYHKNRWMASILSSILSLIVLSCLGFVFYAIKFEFYLPQSWETGLGLGGLLMLLFSHGCLMRDIKVGVGLLEYAIGLLNIVPPGFLNMATCYIILKKHPEQQFIAYSGLIGFGCAIIEFMLLNAKAIHDKFPGGNNGPPAVPPAPQNVEALAQQVMASAAQVTAAEERVEATMRQIKELLARLQGAEGALQHIVENSGDGLRGILVERSGQLQSNNAQNLVSGLLEEGDLGDSNGTVNPKKDLPITKLSEELPAPGQAETNELDKKMTGQAETNELDKKMTHHIHSGSCDGDDEKKTGQAETNELDKKMKHHIRSGSCDGDDGKKTGLGKTVSIQSGSCDGDDDDGSESSKSEPGSEGSLGTSRGSCSPATRGWPEKYLPVTGFRPQTHPQKFGGNRHLIC